MQKLTIRDIDVSGKRVLVRVDFNVPLGRKKGGISDDSRIRAVLPTIYNLIERGASVILCSHMGRPDGKVVESLRMGVVGACLSELLKKPVKIVEDCIGSEAKQAAESLQAGEVLLLENLRFYPEEEKNDSEFARSLASLADIYVNDAFGTAHRKHASVVGVTKYLPSVAGLLIEKELLHLGGVMEKPAHPFGGLFGGAKVSDKVEMLENIMGNIDYLFIGGSMAATFLKAKGYETGLSLIEEDSLGTATNLMENAESNGAILYLPLDVVVTAEADDKAIGETVDIENIPPDKKIVDIGLRTIEYFSKKLRGCKTVFWNGPMGISEIPQFALATRAMAELLAETNAVTIIGGGSSAEVMNSMGLANKITFISTGGGATLSYLGGQKLPGVEALMDKSD
ncbi:phosphoglycerate kinase [Chloroflexota bacterium]